MGQVRFPTLDDLSYDVSREAAQFCAFLDGLYRSQYHKRAAGKIVHMRCTVTPNFDGARQLVDWTLRMLKEERFASRSYFRLALESVAENAAEYRALRTDCVPWSGDLIELVNKHQLVSKSARASQKAGALTMQDWWNMCEDPLAMILMMTLIETKCRKQLNSLRLFAAHGAAIDGLHPEFCQVIKDFAQQKCGDTQLISLRREFRKLLSNFYAADQNEDSDPSFTFLIELGYKPLERICSPSIDWSELCNVAYGICATLISRQSAGSELAAVLRSTMECPLPAAGSPFA